MSTQLTTEHLEAMFGSLLGCCLHSPVWTPGDAAEVLCSVWNGNGSGGWADCTPPEAWGDWKGGTESASYTVVRLKDGRYGLLSESEDYTGHGCQCSAATNIYGGLPDLLALGIEEWRGGAREAIAERLNISVVAGKVVGDSGEIEAK